MGEENMRGCDGRVVVGMEWESNEWDIVMAEAIMGLGKNLVLGKFLEIYKDDPAKIPSNRGERATTGLLL